MIRAFRKLAKEQEPFAGGKGRTLARLYQAGYQVADGFIILPTSFIGDELTTGLLCRALFGIERRLGPGLVRR